MTGTRYAGRRFAFATMHGKDGVVAPAFRRSLGSGVFALPGIDTDRFGTFSGEVEREGTPAEAALRKARLAAEEGGTGLGLGSEGSFGPDPAFPMVAIGVEHLAVVDWGAGLSLVERLAGYETNFAHATVADMAETAGFLARVGWPSHALIVRAAEPGGRGPVEAMGITTEGALSGAVAAARARSSLGRAQLETDMRADRNPTRQAMIARLAERLAERLARPCPACGAPGWGAEETLAGLPCGWCDTPTFLPRATLWRCPTCAHGSELPVPGQDHADPGACPVCNP